MRHGALAFDRILPAPETASSCSLSFERRVLRGKRWRPIPPPLRQPYTVVCSSECSLPVRDLSDGSYSSWFHRIFPTGFSITFVL